MKYEIVTLFPDYFALSLRQSLIGKALEKQLFEIEIINLRDFATDRHHTVDDTPYGGGGGMVLKLEPLDRCLQSLGWQPRDKAVASGENRRLLLTSAAGTPLTQHEAVKMSLLDRLTIICGHYLGVDERLLDLYDIEEISIGDYTLSGGEPAAAVIVDCTARLIPGVLGNFESAINDSHMESTLGWPVYTKPVEYAGLKVPEPLVNGNHKEIERFRREAALLKCAANRPDLLEKQELTAEERALLNKTRKKEH
ncbi:MAG TPA: tRNA (guanosine(37)-N1)-methyltransferase TrmD [candidate division Zixibacteria bacterium]|nr:tRNA (guanosine(37)-N1)-methyltransferase TrmD [candidate division Zixibacteria bacterium]